MEIHSSKGESAGDASIGNVNGGHQGQGNLPTTTTNNTTKKLQIMLLIPKYTIFPHTKREQYFDISQIVFPGTLVISVLKKRLCEICLLLQMF